jgi:hypothetical protein
MSVEAMTVNTVDPDGKWLYRVGGICALAIGIAYLTILPLFARVGNPPPSGGELWLKYLEGKTMVWWAILGLSVFTDFLFVPVALSLYVALERVNRNAMLVATAFVGLFVVLDLAVLWTNYAALLTLRGLYAAATNDDQPQRCISLVFEENETARTQEFVLRWSPDSGSSVKEIVRQQWNFSPPESVREVEEYQVQLSGVTVLELIINPNVGGGAARASLKNLRLS